MFSFRFYVARITYDRQICDKVTDVTKVASKFNQASLYRTRNQVGIKSAAHVASLNTFESNIIFHPCVYVILSSNQTNHIPFHQPLSMLMPKDILITTKEFLLLIFFYFKLNFLSTIIKLPYKHLNSYELFQFLISIICVINKRKKVKRKLTKYFFKLVLVFAHRHVAPTVNNVA